MSRRTVQWRKLLGQCGGSKEKLESIMPSHSVKGEGKTQRWAEDQHGNYGPIGGVRSRSVGTRCMGQEKVDRVLSRLGKGHA